MSKELPYIPCVKKIEDFGRFLKQAVNLLSCL
ncbi:hypothetical protein [Escherichia coli]